MAKKLSLRQRIFQKLNPVSGVISMNTGQAVWTPRDYENLAREGYLKNNVFYSCVDLIASNASQINWQVCDKNGDPVENHPALDLLNQPNPFSGKAAFIYAIVANYLIAGNSYINAVSSASDDDYRKEPTELWVNRPDRYKVIEGTNGVAGYEYKSSGKTKTFKADQVTGKSNVLHWKSFHPLNDYYGMSCLEAAAVGIDIYNQSMTWNKSFFDNGARPSGALVYKGKEDDGTPHFMSAATRANIKKIFEEDYQGSDNNGKPFLFDHLEWIQFSLSQKDMDFLNLKETTAKDIARATGVPPILLNIGNDSTFSNQAEGRLSLWEDTIIPMLSCLVDELNTWLMGRYNDGSTLKLDLSKVSALELRREKQWERARLADFISTNQKLEMVGLPTVEGGDDILVPANMIPLGFDMEMQQAEETQKKKYR